MLDLSHKLRQLRYKHEQLIIVIIEERIDQEHKHSDSLTLHNIQPLLQQLRKKVSAALYRTFSCPSHLRFHQPWGYSFSGPAAVSVYSILYYHRIILCYHYYHYYYYYYFISTIRAIIIIFTGRKKRKCFKAGKKYTT